MKKIGNVCCIVAADQARGIGLKGQLPWNLKKEFAYFTKMTKTSKEPGKMNAVVMGRLTWESIPAKARPLKDRINVVLTSKPETVKDEGVKVCPTLEKAIEELGDSVNRIWVVGGHGVYKDAMNHPLCSRVYYTDILKRFDCDTFYPEIPESFTMLKDHGDESDSVPIEKQVEDGVEYYFRIYERK